MGHDFGEVRTDREREERGEEVLVTVREYRECDRCGETRVLSENKEVRTTAADPSPADDAADDGDDEPATAAGAEADLEEVSAEEDDGVILPDEGEASEGRGRGEWPDRDEEAEAEAEDEPSEGPTPWPEVEGEDEGYAAEPSEGGAAEGVDFSGGLTPEASAAPADPDAGATASEADDVVEAAGDRGSSGIRRARPSPEPTGPQREADPDAEFYCPECEYTAASDGSSLRPGDICPECRLGYLTERSG